MKYRPETEAGLIFKFCHQNRQNKTENNDKGTKLVITMTHDYI